MSQQSTLKMMRPYFDRWMRRFPTLESMAWANEDEVLQLWEGLGYYSRARNLHRAAKVLSNEFPRTPGELIKIPGIGAYTAAAIAATAFDHPVLAVDGNVTRVLSRIFGIPDALNSVRDRRLILKLAQEIAPLAPVGKRGALAQAFMELGAMICRPGNLLRCEACPLAGKICGSGKSLCSTASSPAAAGIPRKKLRREPVRVSRLLLVYRNAKGFPLLRRIPRGRSLAGQWEIPYLDLSPSEAWIEQSLSRHFEVGRRFRHTIMHRSYQVWPLELGRIAVLPKGHMLWAPQRKRGKGPSQQPSQQVTLSTCTRKYLSRQVEDG